ncbi:MAG: T9SS type A sorting domain-containing protein [Ignavibacteria bacterium]|nr:T9SS type A sorting domain-containing protein [Ignavibacteria bacterium]
MKVIAVIVCLLVSLAQGQAQVEWTEMLKLKVGAYALTTNGVIVAYAPYKVHLSLDTGKTWSSSVISVENRNAPSYLPALHVQDEDRIVLSGIGIYRNTNGFETEAWYEAYESVDSGRTWTVYDLPTRVEKTYELDLGNSGHACMYGDFRFMVSLDDFKSYVSVPFAGAWTDRNNLQHCLSVEEGPFFCYGHGGAMYRTSDSGRSLQKAIVPTTNDLSDMMFVDREFGVCVGKNSTVLKTDNGGTSWSDVQSGIPADITCVFIRDTATWMIGAELGWVKVTTDGGSTWRDISPSDHTPSNDVTNVVILGPNDYMISTLQGAYRGKDIGGSTSVPDSLSSRHSVTSSMLSIAPNPSTNSATITVADRSPVLRLYDASGRLVASYKVENGRVVVKTSELSNGVYNVVSDTGSGVLVVNR